MQLDPPLDIRPRPWHPLRVNNERAGVAVRQYRGAVTEHGQLVVVEEGGESRGLDPRFDLHAHTPDGFAWGLPGRGAAQLALALAADATGDDARAKLVADDLAYRLTAALPADGWVLSEREVVETVRDIERERFARAAVMPRDPASAATEPVPTPLARRLDRHLTDLAAYPPADTTDREAVMRERGLMEAIQHLDGRGGLSLAGRVEAGKLVAASEDWLREQADEPAEGWSR